MRVLSVAAITLCAAVFPGHLNATEGVYRWVDAQGRVHFGDRAQAPSHAQPLRAPPVVTTQREVVVGGGAAADAAACEAATAALRNYQAAERIIQRDSAGDRERELDDAEREQLIRRSEVEVSRACGTDAAPAAGEEILW